jgi:hypothetical protein
MFQDATGVVKCPAFVRLIVQMVGEGLKVASGIIIDFI